MKEPIIETLFSLDRADQEHLLDHLSHCYDCALDEHSFADHKGDWIIEQAKLCEVIQNHLLSVGTLPEKGVLIELEGEQVDQFSAFLKFMRQDMEIAYYPNRLLLIPREQFLMMATKALINRYVRRES
jgi:hypothetical protein